MAREVVRRLTSQKTHISDVRVTAAASMFGAEYRKPIDAKTLCGVSIGDQGVVMQAGTAVNCRRCTQLIDQKTSAEIYAEGFRAAARQGAYFGANIRLVRNPYEEV